MKSHQEGENHHQQPSSTSSSFTSPLPPSRPSSYQNSQQSSPESSVIYSQPEDPSSSSLTSPSGSIREEHSSRENSSDKENILEGATFLTSFRKEAPLMLHFNLTTKTSPGIKANISINGYSIDPEREAALISSSMESSGRIRSESGERRAGRITRRITRANSREKILEHPRRKNGDEAQNGDMEDNLYSSSSNLDFSSLNHSHFNGTKSWNFKLRKTS